jgi:hypothetical protein
MDIHYVSDQVHDTCDMVSFFLIQFWLHVISFVHELDVVFESKTCSHEMWNLYHDA